MIRQKGRVQDRTFEIEFLDHNARSCELIARVCNGQSEGLTRDDILDNITAWEQPQLFSEEVRAGFRSLGK